MEKPQFEIMNRVEDSHFWYRGMREITRSVLDGFIDKKDNVILDAGCGTGANLPFLKRYGKVTGIDISKEAIKYCRLKKLKNVKTGSVNNIPYPDNYFDLVTSFDVLGQEGVDEKKALTEFYRVTKPGGLIFLRVAAYPFLYSLHDKIVHNIHRYTKKDFMRIVRSGNFSFLRISYINMLLFPIIAVRRILFKSKTGSQSDVFSVPNWLNNILLIPLLIESRLINHVSFPFGLSLIILIRSNKKNIK